MDKEEKRLRRGNAALTALIILLVPILIVGVMAFANEIFNPDSGNMFGVRILAVKTDSMEPDIKKGAYVVVYAAPFEKISVKDIITFKEPSGEYNTHRVIAVDNGVLVTQGDNSRHPDERGVTASNYRYKHLFTVNAAANMRGEGGFMWALTYLVLPCFGVLAAIIILRIFLKSRAKKRGGIAADADNDTFQPPVSQDEFAPPALPLHPQEAFISSPLEKQLDTALDLPLPSLYDLQLDSGTLYAENNDRPLTLDWRQDIFNGLDFTGVDLSDPALENIDLRHWIYS
jgi:signal peptidase I